MNTKKPYTADHLADDIHQGYLALKGFGIGLLAWLLGQTLIIAGTFAVYLLTTLLLIAMNWANPAIIIALTIGYGVLGIWLCCSFDRALTNRNHSTTSIRN